MQICVQVMQARLPIRSRDVKDGVWSFTWSKISRKGDGTTSPKQKLQTQKAENWFLLIFSGFQGLFPWGSENGFTKITTQICRGAFVDQFRVKNHPNRWWHLGVMKRRSWTENQQFRESCAAVKFEAVFGLDFEKLSWRFLHDFKEWYH